LSTHAPALLYPSGSQVVCRTLALHATSDVHHAARLIPHPPPLLNELSANNSTLVYRGHSATVTAARISNAGRDVASGDSNGCLKIWAFRHEKHPSKYQDAAMLTGPLRAVEWDGDGQNLLVCGEAGSDSACAKVLTLGTCETNDVATDGFCASGTFSPGPPRRVVTSGHGGSIFFHSGENETASIKAGHAPGSIVHRVTYQPNAGAYIASVGSDKSLCISHGTTGVLLSKQKKAHKATIYDVEWNGRGTHVLTASGDGTCKLWRVLPQADTVVLTNCAIWHVAKHQAGIGFTEVPRGGWQMGCTFVQNGTIPVASSFNGELHILRGYAPAQVPHNSIASGASTALWCQTVTGHHKITLLFLFREKTFE
jgi:WD40 repeat protein